MTNMWRHQLTITSLSRVTCRATMTSHQAVTSQRPVTVRRVMSRRPRWSSRPLLSLSHVTLHHHHYHHHQLLYLTTVITRSLSQVCCFLQSLVTCAVFIYLFVIEIIHKVHTHAVVVHNDKHIHMSSFRWTMVRWFRFLCVFCSFKFSLRVVLCILSWLLWVLLSYINARYVGLHVLTRVPRNSLFSA